MRSFEGAELYTVILAIISSSGQCKFRNTRNIGSNKLGLKAGMFSYHPIHVAAYQGPNTQTHTITHMHSDRVFQCYLARCTPTLLPNRYPCNCAEERAKRRGKLCSRSRPIQEDSSLYIQLHAVFGGLPGHRHAHCWETTEVSAPISLCLALLVHLTLCPSPHYHRIHCVPMFLYTQAAVKGI